MITNIIKNVSWIHSKSTTSTKVVNKGHEKFYLSSKLDILHNKFYDNIDDNNIRLMVLNFS